MMAEHGCGCEAAAFRDRRATEIRSADLGLAHVQGIS
jgi:hypothetical protein